MSKQNTHTQITPKTANQADAKENKNGCGEYAACELFDVLVPFQKIGMRISHIRPKEKNNQTWWAIHFVLATATENNGKIKKDSVTLNALSFS
jgi:hypothetical protein